MTLVSDGVWDSAWETCSLTGGATMVDIIVCLFSPFFGKLSGVEFSIVEIQPQAATILAARSNTLFKPQSDDGQAAIVDEFVGTPSPRPRRLRATAP
eukprot:5928591-Amphidinium_carterae.1